MLAAVGAIETAMAATVSKRDRNSLRIWVPPLKGMGRVWAELTTAVNSTPRLECPKCERLPGYKTKVPASSTSAWAAERPRKAVEAALTRLIT